MRDASVSQWGNLNHIAGNRVDSIVTDSALRMDQASVQMILENIIKEQKMLDFKKEVQSRDRAQLRHRLKTSHNDKLQVKLG